MQFNRINNITGWVVALIACTVYILTAEAGGSLWDCGEFVSSCFKVQIPHPPGAPLFVLLGRIFIVFFGNDPLTAAISVGGSILGGVLSGGAAKDAANTQAASAAEAQRLQKEMFDIQNAQQAAGRGLGYQGFNQIRSMLPGQYTKYDEQGKPIGTATGQDYLTHQFTAQDFANNIDPGYAFRLQQGQMANQAAANRGGGLIGGNALTGLQDYTQGMASQEFGNAFNRYQAQRTNIYNTLASTAGLGQTAQQQQNQLAQNFANNQTGLTTAAGAAQAAGQIGAANAYGGALNNIGNTFAFSRMINPATTTGNVSPTSGISGAGGLSGFGVA